MLQLIKKFDCVSLSTHLAFNGQNKQNYVECLYLLPSSKKVITVHLIGVCLVYMNPLSPTYLRFRLQNLLSGNKELCAQTYAHVRDGLQFFVRSCLCNGFWKLQREGQHISDAHAQYIILLHQH